MVTFPFQGILLAGTSGFATSSSAAVSKLLSGLHPLEVVIYRDVAQLLVSGIIVFKDGVSILGHPGERKYLFLRALLGSLSMMFYYMAIRLTTIGDASAIFDSYPPFITFLAWLLLGEPFGWFNGVANVLTVAGILVLTGPRYIAAMLGYEMEERFTSNDTWGLVLALLACLAKTCGNLSIRFINKTPSVVVVVWFSVLSGVLSAMFVPMLDQYHAPRDNDWMFLLTIGCLGITTQFTITMALKLEQAATVAITEGLSMIVSFLYQVYLFREPLHLRSYLGAILILSAIMLVGLKKIHEVREDKSKQTKSPLTMTGVVHSNTVD